MKLASNNEDFEDYVGNYVIININGIERKFLVQYVTRFTDFINTELLDNPVVYNYKLLGNSYIQECT